MENDHFPGIGEIRAVQHQNKRQFSNKNARFSQKAVNYRKVRVYTKSLERFRKEWERRRRMRLLADEGLSQKEIAKELGVSTQTVKRDWDRARSYVKGQCNKELKEVAEKRRLGFEQRFEGLPVKDELELLKHDVKGASKLMQAFRSRSGQCCREMFITLHLDDQSPDCFPLVEVFPIQQNLRLSQEFDLKIHAWKNGQKRELCSLHFST